MLSCQGSIVIYTGHETFKPWRDIPCIQGPKEYKAQTWETLGTMFKQLESIIHLHPIPIYTYLSVQYHAKSRMHLHLKSLA